MAFSPDAISQARYLTDVKTTVVQWLDYHLADGDGDEGFAAQWAKFGGVDVAVRNTADIAEDDTLAKPLLSVWHSSDEINNTILNSSDGQFLTNGAFHTITLAVSVACDEDTGGQITLDDLLSAVGVSFDRYRFELETAGIAMLKFRAIQTATNEFGGLLTSEAEIVCDVQVRGSNLRTIVLELGRLTITAKDSGTYSDGHELTTASSLRLKCVTGFRVFDTAVTVYAKNQVGVASTLTGTIPNGSSAGTLVALTPAVVGETYTDVTNIAITGGVAGEIFVVENIPQDV